MSFILDDDDVLYDVIYFEAKSATEFAIPVSLSATGGFSVIEMKTNSEGQSEEASSEYTAADGIITASGDEAPFTKGNLYKVTVLVADTIEDFFGLRDIYCRASSGKALDAKWVQAAFFVYDIKVVIDVDTDSAIPESGCYKF